MSKRVLNANSATHICSRCGLRQIGTHNSGWAGFAIICTIIGLLGFVYNAGNGHVTGIGLVAIFLQGLGLIVQVYSYTDTRCIACQTPHIVPLNTPGGRELSARFPDQ